MKSTTANINKRIAKFGLEIIRGKGYQYFLSLATGDQIGESVMVCYLNNLSLDGWERAAKAHVMGYNLDFPNNAQIQEVESGQYEFKALTPEAREAFTHFIMDDDGNNVLSVYYSPESKRFEWETSYGGPTPITAEYLKNEEKERAFLEKWRNQLTIA